jgi:DNA-binding NtrC family response regulator/tetratricopeptide (TPR) repeat protein
VTDHPSPSHSPSKPALGGRRDLTQLSALHEELTRARGGVVVLEGRRGVGKAALLAQLRRNLSGKGRLVLFGRAEQTATAPYACLSEPAAQALAYLEAQGLAEQFLDRHAAALGLLLPSLAAQTGGARSQDKTGFFEALRAFFLDLAKTAPPTLLLADVHYADDDTRDLLRFLAAHLFDPDGPGGAPADGFSGVLMLACRSDDEVGARVIGELRVGGRFRSFDVEGLDREELLTYLKDHPGLDRLLKASGGRPEDVDELLEAVPADTDTLLLERVRALDEDSQRCLRALSVVGRPAPPDLISNVAELPIAKVAQLLAGLVDRRLLARRLSNGELLFTFARAHHNETLRAHLSDEERLRLHRRIGEVLEARPAQESIDQLLAYYFLRGDEPERGVPYALEASERLLVTFAYASAAELIESALTHADSDEQRFALLGQLVEAERARGQLAKALEAARRMREVARAGQLPPVLRRLGEILAGRGDFRAALEILEEALERLADAGTNGSEDVLPERALVLAAMSEVAYRKGDLEAAQQGARDAVSAAPGAPVAFQLRAANTLAKVEYSREHFEQAEEFFLENLALAEKNELDHEAMQARVNAGLARFRLGQYAEAREILERALGQARVVGDLSFEAQALLNLGVICQRESDIGRAIQYFLGALSLFSRMGKRLQLRLTTWNLANVYVAVGQFERARTYLEQSRRISEADDSDRGRAFVHFTNGDIAFDQGQFGVALSAYENARSLFSDLGDATRVMEMTVKSAWAAVELGDLDAATGRVAEIGDVEDTTALQRARARAIRGAVLAAVREAESADTSEGIAQLARAIDELEDAEADEDAWRALVFLAARYAERGDTASSDAARTRARAIVGRYGDKLTPELYKSFLDNVALGLFASDDALQRHRDAVSSEGAPVVDEAPAPVATPIPQPTGPASRHAEWDSRYPEIVGTSTPLLRVFDRLDRIARTSHATVLIRGQSGTGKELVAAAIHRMSDRRDGPFVRVNCAALVETLLMSELFGHEKGSFTGAFSRKIGRFELARGGTIFLDEIGDISPKTQVSLLRVLQEKSFERVGGTATIKTDAVVICATHRDLEQMVRDGSFREDLYYRLRGVVVEVPALCDRPDDIPVLARHFLQGAAAELGRAPTQLSPEAEVVLRRYRWPGNIRELQNVVRSVALFCEGDIVETHHLAEFPELFDDTAAAPPPPPRPAMPAPPVQHPEVTAPFAPMPPMPSSTGPAAPLPPGSPAPEPGSDVMRKVDEAAAEGMALGDLKRKLEFEAIANAMRQTGGNITKAAKLLKMKRPRLSQIVNGNPELKSIKESARAGRA